MNFFRFLKKDFLVQQKNEFFEGISNFWEISYDQTMIFWFCLSFFVYDYITLQIFLNTMIFCRVYLLGVNRLLPWTLKTILSRIVSFWVFYSIYDEESYIMLALLPIFGIWYVYDPILLIGRKISFSERLEYFFMRYPFIYGFSLVPMIVHLMVVNEYIHFYIYVWILIIMVYHRNINTVPMYATYLPFTTKTHTLDPIDYLDDYLNNL